MSHSTEYIQSIIRQEFASIKSQYVLADRSNGIPDWLSRVTSIWAAVRQIIGLRFACCHSALFDKPVIKPKPEMVEYKWPSGSIHRLEPTVAPTDCGHWVKDMTLPQNAVHMQQVCVPAINVFKTKTISKDTSPFCLMIPIAGRVIEVQHSAQFLEYNGDPNLFTFWWGNYSTSLLPGLSRWVSKLLYGWDARIDMIVTTLNIATNECNETEEIQNYWLYHVYQHHSNFSFDLYLSFTQPDGTVKQPDPGEQPVFNDPPDAIISEPTDDEGGGDVAPVDPVPDRDHGCYERRSLDAIEFTFPRGSESDLWRNQAWPTSQFNSYTQLSAKLLSDPTLYTNVTFSRLSDDNIYPGQVWSYGPRSLRYTKWRVIWDEKVPCPDN